MAIYEELKRNADTCFDQLTADELIEFTDEWRIDAEVWRLKFDSNSAGKGYGAYKM
jgi:hypothetical protein